MSEYDKVFKFDLGTLKEVVVELRVNLDREPKFCKERSSRGPVPYALKEKIVKEFERLIANDIYKHFQCSIWAAPIVPVLKNDGFVRICGNYKQTINQASLCDKYPVPKTKDLFSALFGGKTISKLGLTDTYQQLPLSEKSHPLLTVNTYKVLFEPEQLQFAVYSA